MSRYDGLIIPRSYNDYFSRSRPDDLRQFMRTVTQSTFDPKNADPLNGIAVNGALANQTEFRISATNGSVNDLIPSAENTISTYRGAFTDSPFADSGTKIVTSEYINGTSGIYQTIKMYGTQDENYSPHQYCRYGYKNSNTYKWSDWKKIIAETDLNDYDKAGLWTDTLISITDNNTLKAGKEITFTVNNPTISDLPVEKRGIVITRKNSLNNRCIQEYHCNENTNNNIYYRYLEWNESKWFIAINWEKLVTENEVPIIKGFYTDCNSCYEVPKANGMKVSYYQAQANSPDNNYDWTLEVKVTKSGTTFFGSQIAIRNGGVPLMYIRTLSFDTSGVATSFGKWRKITLDES